MNKFKIFIILLSFSFIILNSCELPLFKTIEERPQAPILIKNNIITNENIGADWVKINFTPVKNAVEYYFYYSNVDTIDWIKCTEIEIVKNESDFHEYKISNLKSNTKYSFYVTAIGGLNQESEKSNTINIQTKLQSPVITNATQHNHYSIEFKWNSVSGADYYIIFYSENISTINNKVNMEMKPDGKYRYNFIANNQNNLYMQWNITNNNYEIKTFENSNTLYNIWVQAYTGSWEDITNYSDFSPIRKERTKLKQPVMLTVDEDRSTSSELFLNWESIPDASSYEVRFCKYSESEMKNVNYWIEKRTDKTDIMIDNLESYTLYVFKVKALNTNNSSEYSEQSLAYRTRLEIPVITPAEISSNSIKILWNKMDNVSRYRLYRSGQNINTPSVPISINSETNSYELNNLKENSQYNFSLTAIDLSGYEGDLLNFTYYTLLSKPENLVAETVSDKEITLSWDAKDGASGYIVEVYEDDPDNNSLTWIRKTPLANIIRETKFNVDGLPSPNKTYYFFVRAINMNAKNYNENDPREGERSTPPSTAVTLLSSPQNLKALWLSRSVNLSWEAVSGADFYKIYYSKSNSFNTAIHCNPGQKLTNNYYTVQELDRNTIYYLWVQAFNDNGNYSHTSQVIQGRTIVSNVIIEFDPGNTIDPILQGIPEKIIQITKDSYTIEVITNGNGWANTFKWYLNGIEKNGTRNYFTIDWTLPVGSYELSVIATRNGVPYSASAQFKVLNN